MSKKWTDATALYRKANEAKQAEKKAETEGTALRQAARDLKAFLQSQEGQEARVLLEESGQRVELGEYSWRDNGWDADCGDFDHGMVTTGVRFDGTGLHQYVDREESLFGGPSSDSASAIEAVKSAILYLHWKPDEILSKIRAELDKIADAAPKE